MCSFKSIYFVIFVLNLYKTNAEISDKRLCADPDCKEPVSLAKTLLRYSSPGPGILSFSPNEKVTVFSKEAGSVLDLWGVEIRGKRGYIPKNLVRETKVIKKPELLVDTELNQKSQVPPDVKENPEPNKVQEPFEVVDGTTFYLNPQSGINPSSTESPVVPTAVPPSTDEVGNNAETLKPVEDQEVDKATDKDTEKESVVENVISTISNWMKEDSTSEEIDEAEDDEDDDDEEEVEDEEEEEEDLDENMELTITEGKSQNDSVPHKSEDINSLHNLPAGVLISSYSLQTEAKVEKVQTLPSQAEVKPASTVVPATENVVPPTENVVNNEIKTETTVVKNVIDHAVTAPKTEVANDPINTFSTSNEKSSKLEPNLNYPSALLTDPKSFTDLTKVKDTPSEAKVPSVPQEISNPTTATEVPANSQEIPKVENIQPDIDDKIKKETDDKGNMKDDAIALQPVTEPTVLQYEEAPLINEVTPNPADSVTKELNTGKIAIETPTIEEKVEKTQVLEINTTASHDVEQSLDPLQKETVNSGQTNPDTLQVMSHQTSDNTQTVKNEETTGSFSPMPPLGGLFNSVQSQVSTKVENKIDQPEGENLELKQVSKEEVASEEQNEPIEVSTQNIIRDLGNNIEQNDEVNVPSEDSAPQEATDMPENAEIVSAEAKESEEQNIQNDDNEGTVGLEDNNNVRDPIEAVPGQEESGGLFSNILSLFGLSSDESELNSPSAASPSNEESSDIEQNIWSPQSKESVIDYCDSSVEMCNTSDKKDIVNEKSLLEDIELSFNSDIFLYLLTTSISVIVFLFGYMILDRSRRESPLVSRINKLEKELLITLKENELLQEKGSNLIIQEVEQIPNDVEQLTQQLTEVQLANQALEIKVAELSKELEEKEALEEQIESLEKELETSTEVGMELNRIISEMLDPKDGSEKLKENVEQLQRQLLEQKDTINTINIALKEKESENQMMLTQLEKSKKKSGELQSKLEEMVDKVLQIEKEKDQQQSTLQNEISIYHQKYSEAVNKVDILNNEIQILKVQLAESQRQTDIKTKEYKKLQESLEKIKLLKNDRDALRSLLDTTTINAELQQMKLENENYIEQLQHEQSLKAAYEKKYQTISEEVNLLHQKYEQADKEKVEANSRLEVLNNYFKKRETELQEELMKYKSIWEAKEGEATSTTERIKYMQEEIQNYKAQNETLKQEIISQEIELKSQISMLEKKVHENWVTARQTERKLEDAKQEAAQLRNRLTLRERAINEERVQNRLQSPVEQNGELPLSPHPIDSPASPPLLFGARDHITKSPPIPGLPPFLPPPPGAPFMPPPLHGMPPFMPPPPSMFPGDHRPPPLGRMSSPPLNSRYSPDTSAFSPYDRNSPSPPYDSEYGTSPPPIRGYSPYNSRDDRRDYKRPPHVRTNGRNLKGSVMSSGSEHSNDSLDKINRKQSKMV